MWVQGSMYILVGGEVQTNPFAAARGDNNNNNNNNQGDVYGAVIMASHYQSSSGSFEECRVSAEMAANSQTKPTDLH